MHFFSDFQVKRADPIPNVKYMVLLYKIATIAAAPVTVTWISLFSGSGSSYLYGFFDQAWKEGLSKDEAEVR